MCFDIRAPNKLSTFPSKRPAWRAGHKDIFKSVWLAIEGRYELPRMYMGRFGDAWTGSSYWATSICSVKFCIISCCFISWLASPKREAVQYWVAQQHPKCTAEVWGWPFPVSPQPDWKWGVGVRLPTQTTAQGLLEGHWFEDCIISAERLESAKDVISAWDFQLSYLNNTRRFCS